MFRRSGKGVKVRFFTGMASEMAVIRFCRRVHRSCRDANMGTARISNSDTCMVNKRTDDSRSRCSAHLQLRQLSDLIIDFHKAQDLAGRCYNRCKTELDDEAVPAPLFTVMALKSLTSQATQPPSTSGYNAFSG